MADFSPTKFIDKNVKLQYKNFDVNHNWHTITVTKIHGHNDNIFLGKFVYCDIKFDNGEIYKHFLFRDKEYESNSDNAWTFAHPWCVSINEIKELNHLLFDYNCTSKNTCAYNKTVEYIKYTNRMRIPEGENEGDEEAEYEADDDDEDDDDDNDDDDDDDEDYKEETEDEIEDNNNDEYYKKETEDDVHKITIIYPGFWSAVIISSMVSTIATTIIIYASNIACSIY